MTESHSGAEVHPETVLNRLRAMGLEAELMQGGRCAVATMRVGPQPFETLSGLRSVDEVVFATVGVDRIKCLKPRMLFQLPMLRIVDCPDSTAIEARIRLAWQKHMAELRRVTTWLHGIGAEPTPSEEGSLLSFGISGESPTARVAMFDSEHVVLPSPGPLSGVALQRAEDRVMRVDRSIQSSLDLEIALSTRMEELVRLDGRLTEQKRKAAMTIPPEEADAPEKMRSPRLLLVGPHLASERTCIESLRLRGYDVIAVRSQQEAIAALDRLSPELVLVDMTLGRSDGIELIPALRQISGIEEVPVVLIDEHRRSARREAAQRVGAAGYLVHPLDVSRIARRLAKIVNEPSRRRFTRYLQKVSVVVSGIRSPALGTVLGRGGMFLATDEDLPNGSVHTCELTLPSLGRSLRVEAEVLYRRSGSGSQRKGVGMRFRGFPDEEEPTFIEFLRTLESSPA
ncbi:MAG: response regulator [Proteobacteria bacterium]|nr:response regulator [Pseudomonadota bacterium]